MAITTNMGLTTWGPNDYFNDLDLKTNWEKVDTHDHDPSNDGGVRIGSNGINNDAIVESKLADGAVTDEKIANGTITKFKLANDLVVALENAAEALSTNTVFGTSTTATVTGDYENLKLKDGSIVDTHVAEGAQISPSKIQIITQSGSPLSNTNGVVDTNAVSSNGGVRGPFNSLNIQPNAVGEGQIADGAVTGSKLGTSAVTSAKIADSTIATGDLSPSVANALTSARFGWASYSPARGWINNNGAIVTGGLVAYGAYQQIHNVMHVRIDVVALAQTVMFGSGITFSLPANSVARASGTWTMATFANPVPSHPSYGVSAVGEGGSSVYSYCHTGAGGTQLVGNDNAWATWPSGAVYTISLTYQTG